jgi:hypothetical protein
MNKELLNEILNKYKIFCGILSEVNINEEDLNKLEEALKKRKI